MTLVVRTAKLPTAPPDALRVTRRGSWLGLPDQLPRCYLELRADGVKPEAIKRWRAGLRSFLRTISASPNYRELFRRSSVTLVCCCIDAPCARFVIAEFLAEQGAFVEKENLK